MSTALLNPQAAMFVKLALVALVIAGLSLLSHYLGRRRKPDVLNGTDDEPKILWAVGVLCAIVVAIVLVVAWCLQ